MLINHHIVSLGFQLFAVLKVIELSVTGAAGAGATAAVLNTDFVIKWVIQTLKTHVEPPRIGNVHI